MPGFVPFEFGILLTGANMVKNFLKVLVDPPEVELDIVAVHGLNPSNKEDHAEATWTASNNKMWLKDFLPTQLPTARILLFGYNADVAFETSVAGVEEYVESLLNRLRGKRRVSRTAMTRPIIFICHSLEGIITKKALTISKLDPKY
ncbi:hypothetical protein BDD12DRAFT_846410 [Trichophaea hybrida]|nr:hypothetical protein BDD12DRAFT_846410 [Trichophaea hybrida]